MALKLGTSKATHNLRFGVICYGPVLENWQVHCLKQLLKLPRLQIALLIICVRPGNFQSLFSFEREDDKSHAPALLLSKIAFRPKALRKATTDMLSDLTSIYCKTIVDGQFRRFSDNDVQRIAKHDLDFILDFGFERITGAILDVPRHGIWFFHHGEIEEAHSAPACFWEIYNAKNVTASFLLKLTDTPNAFVVLRKGYFKTVDYSYSRNVDSVYLGCVHWPAQVCLDILNNHAAYLNGPPIYSKLGSRALPNTLQTVIFSVKTFRNMLRKLHRGIFRHDEWNIGVIKGSIATVLEDSLPTPLWLPKAKKGTILADPFPVTWNGKVYVLCELLKTKGVIVCIEITDPTKPSLPQVVIELPHHISYPYVVLYNAQVYCIPETAEANEVYLYRAVDFPHKWTRDAVLIKDFAAVDSTIFRHEGRWWLMCSARGQDHNLFVWYSDDISGPWTPHAGNPVKTDIRSARPAGTPFVHGGQLYRPAQDSSTLYGQRIVINRIKCLTPVEFEEEQVKVIEPFRHSDYPDGIHTVSAAGNMILCDGKHRRFLGIWPIISILRDRLHNRTSSLDRSLRCSLTTPPRHHTLTLRMIQLRKRLQTCAHVE